MVADTHPPEAGGADGVVVRAPCAALTTVRPKLFRRASLTSWGKDNLGMTRAAADLNLTELMLTVQQQKYEDRSKAAQREMSHTAAYEGNLSIRQRNERRAMQLDRRGARRQFLEKWERKGRQKWNRNQATMCRYERRLLNFELAVKATSAARQRISRTRHADDEASGIQWFENNLDKLGLDPGGSNRRGGAGAGGGTVLAEKETQAAFSARLLRSVLDQKFVPLSNAETMAELRFRGNAGRRARREREHRRIKTEVDQRHAKAATDAQRAGHDHFNSMLQESRERREVAAVCWEKRHASRFRELHDKKAFAELAVARQNAFEAAFHERSSLTRERYAAGSSEREADADTRRAKLHSDRAGKRRRVEAMCSEVAHKLSDLAVVASEARAHQGGAPLPPTVWMHLKRWFCSSEPLFSDDTAPVSSPEPMNPVLETKILLEGRNLDRCEGLWHPRWSPPAELSDGASPLSEALSIARDLVEASGNVPREAPTYGRPSGSGGSRKLSVRLVVLGQGKELHDVCRALGRWIHLYVCDMDTALECAMELGAEMVAADGKHGKGRKGSISGNRDNASGRQGSVAIRKKNVVGRESESLADAEKSAAGENAKSVKEANASKAFDSDASEDDVEAFKLAAAAYYALRTHPKKGATPVPLAVKVDVLVKHLSCRAPRGRGWILVGFPKSLLESKVLENALCGYMDDDVMVELGQGRKASKHDAKTKKASVAPQPVETPPPPKSGLDAVLRLTRRRSDETAQDRHKNASPSERRLQIETDTSSVESAPPKRETADGLGERLGEEDEGKTESKAETLAQVTWWKTFEGGRLTCDVSTEANDQRLLETLFLLVNATQNRKDDHQVWQENARYSPEILKDGASQAPLDGLVQADGKAEDRAASTDGCTPSAIAVSPLTVPLEVSLEDLRQERRAAMSHATRLRVEALTGERQLDLEGIRSVISQTKATRRDDAGIDGGDSSISSPVKASLRNLEAACTASSVIDWVIATEFSFATMLRSPDDRWAAVCLRLENEIAGWLARREEATGEKHAHGRRGNLISEGVGGRAGPRLAAPPGGGDRVWEALEMFEIEAGDIVDDRHASADVTATNINREADLRMCAWTEDVESAAAKLCAAEHASYHETVGTLRLLDGLFGLQKDRSSSLEVARETACAAAGALVKEVSSILGVRSPASEESVFVTEIRRAAEVCQQTIVVSAVGETRPKSSPLPQKDSNSNSSSGAGGGTQKQSVFEQPRSNSTPELEDIPCSGNKSDECNNALATAIWRCRLIYARRVGGVVARLVRTVEQCEAKVASMRAAVKRLKRRRVQLEHDGVSVATLTVRRALEDFDRITIRSILHNGVPLWVEDDETFAADPNVALPWGMSGLGLANIANLANSLRRNLEERADEGGGGKKSAADLARTVRAWVRSDVTGERGEGPREGTPPAWTDVTNGYVETLCRVIATGPNGDDVSWKRLIHCLLMGHVRSLPTLDDLRSMRTNFGARALKSPGRLALQSSPETGVAGPTTRAAAPATQEPTLRIAQRHMASIPLWFESEGNNQEAAGGTESGGECTDDASLLSTIKAVYSTAWGDSDGCLGGLDLLLTLCAVPSDCSAADNLSAGADTTCDRDKGIPFSLGVFRAFAMLAETGSNSWHRVSPAGGAAAATAPPACADDQPQRTVTDPSVERKDDVVLNCSPWEESDGIPRVTLPHLRAILEHGGSMSPTDVSVACGFALRAESRMRQKGPNLQQHTPAIGAKGIVGIEEGLAVGVPRGTCLKDNAEEAETGCKVEKDDGGRGAETVGTHNVGASKTEELPKIGTQRKEEMGGEGEDLDAANRKVDEEWTGQDRAAVENPPHEDPVTISFATVCDCEVVRAWVRKGAYTLPSFDVTSGRRHGTFADEVVVP